MENRDVSAKHNVIYDPIYGFIKLTQTEQEIIHTPFYQRLRWIKQLGFSSFTFPGAEHSRFGHSIGVMHNADHILRSCGRAVSEHDLMDLSNQSKEVMYHRMLRLAALMHDLGTFCFSHTTEMAYIKFGDTTNDKGGKGLKDDHENLGSFIIKNTDYPGGITHILKKANIDPQRISDLVKGVDPSYLANQILHSEIDCDRMDYLLRDAHYTGLNYGTYDRDYLLWHFKTARVDNHDILTIKHSAIHCVEDFLTSRFSWYSQVIRSPRGSRYDAVAERICFYFLKKNYIYKYSDLLDMIVNDPLKFYQFNDGYFMGIVYKHYHNGDLDKDPGMKDMVKTLLLESGVRHVACDEFNQQLLTQDDSVENEKIYKRAKKKADELEELIEKHGEKGDWYIPDLPTKNIIFTKSHKSVVKSTDSTNLLLERDPVKISYDNGDIKLLANVENSLISSLHTKMNYTPNFFLSRTTYELLVKKGAIDSKV